jgi:agmatinase
MMAQPEWTLEAWLGIPNSYRPCRKGLATTGSMTRRFDIDSLDPAFAPGTATPEVAGATTREALALLRGFKGLRLVGGIW